MSYLRNVWYAAAWNHEVPAEKLLARQFLDEPVVLFRDETGKPRALFDRCPHRFAPLSLGKLCDGGAEFRSLQRRRPTRLSNAGACSGSGWANLRWLMKT